MSSHCVAQGLADIYGEPARNGPLWPEVRPYKHPYYWEGVPYPGTDRNSHWKATRLSDGVAIETTYEAFNGYLDFDCVEKYFEIFVRVEPKGCA